MPITFDIHLNRGFIESLWRGRIEQSEVHPVYESILNSGDWKPAWCELADLSDARLDHLPTDFVHQQLGFFKRQYRRLSMIGARVAVWAPGDLSFGLARIYQTLTEDNEVEQFVVFRQRVDALEWLLNPPDEES